ncbi:MAG: nuclear transport factor 2 family protein [bacterium]
MQLTPLISDFAQEWIAAWNSHDLNRILSHYSEKVEFHSPFVVKITGDPSGTLKGKEALKAYFTKGLSAYPQLHFELLGAFTGVGSVVLHYKSVQNLTATEMMVFDENGKVAQVRAHYSEGK